MSIPKEINEKTSPVIHKSVKELMEFELTLMKSGQHVLAQNLTQFRIRFQDHLLDKLKAIAYLKRERDNLKKELYEANYRVSTLQDEVRVLGNG